MTTNTNNQPQSRRPITCHKCGLPGHISRGCRAGGGSGTRQWKRKALVQQAFKNDSQKEQGQRDGDNEIRKNLHEQSQEEAETERQRLVAEQEQERIRQDLIEDGQLNQTVSDAKQQNEAFRFSIQRPFNPRFDHPVSHPYSSYIQSFLYVCLVHAVLYLGLVSFVFLQASLSRSNTTYFRVCEVTWRLVHGDIFRHSYFWHFLASPVLYPLIGVFALYRFRFKRLTYKVSFKYVDVNTDPSLLDKRTDDQKRSELKHKHVLRTDVRIKYYINTSQTLVNRPGWSWLRLNFISTRKVKVVSQVRMTQISLELLSQLSKHANNNLNNDPDVTIAKLNQHATYLSTINLNRHELDRHLIQDTVLIAHAWYTHNVQTNLHRELFHALQL